MEQRGLGEQDGKEEASDKGVRGSLAQRQALSRALRAEYDSTCEKWRQDISVEEGGTRCCRAQRTGHPASSTFGPQRAGPKLSTHAAPTSQLLLFSMDL